MKKPRKSETVVKDAEIKRATNKLRKLGQESAVNRLERNLPQK